MNFFLLLFIVTFLTSISVKAQVAERYVKNVIFQQNLKAIDIKVVSNFDTNHCGRKELVGGMRKIGPKESSNPGIVNDYLYMADFTIPSFLESCLPNSPLRHIHLESDAFRINAPRGSIYLEILTPEDMNLEITRIE